MTKEPKDLLAIAIRLATSAGQLVREGAAANQFTVVTKSSATDPVTEIDKASETFIVSDLMETRPDDGVLGEEGAAVESKSGVEWVIDPIDGTTNFVYGIPAYAVSVGVTVDGIPTAGAIYNPALDELYSASVGGGAYLNGQRIYANDITELSLALIGTGFSYSSRDRAAQAAVLAKLMPQVRDLRRIGAASLDMCNVACGRADAYYENGVKPWDVTAGIVIIQEAGGIATGFDGGVARSNIISACTQEIYDELKARVLQ